MAGNCRSRVLYALKWRVLTERQLADELFVCVADIKKIANDLYGDGLVFRNRRHCKRAGRPIFYYSNVKFPPIYERVRYSEDTKNVAALTGDWDALSRTDILKLSRGKP